MPKTDVETNEEVEVHAEVTTVPEQDQDDGLTECEVHSCSHEDTDLMDGFLREAAGLPIDHKTKHTDNSDIRAQDLRGEEVTVAAELANQQAQIAMRAAQTVAATANGPVSASMAQVLSTLHSVTSREDQTDRRTVEMEGDNDRLEQLKKRNSEATRETVEDNEAAAVIEDVLRMMDGAEHERLNRSENSDENVEVTTTAGLMEGTNTDIANTELGVRVSDLALDHARREASMADLATREEEFFELINEAEVEAQLDDQFIKDLHDYYFQEYHRHAIAEGTRELQELAMQHALSGSNPEEVMQLIKNIAARVELNEQEQQELIRAYGGAFSEATM